MSLRCEELGWERAALRCEDPAGRRAVWVRRTPGEEDVPVLVLELCAGREGDDLYVRLATGQVLEHQMLYELREILLYATPGTDDNSEGSEAEARGFLARCSDPFDVDRKLTPARARELAEMLWAAADVLQRAGHGPFEALSERAGA